MAEKPLLKPLGDTVLTKHPVRLEPMNESHIEPLRAACAEDKEIWEIYPVNMLDEHFETSMARFHQLTDWVRLAVLNEIPGGPPTVVGMTSYISPNEHGTVEIGGTYISPQMRGSGFNDIMKDLMINHAFACGYHRVELRVDARNKRSQAAVLKLGAKHEGTLREHMVTWTGHRRSTEVFGLLKPEWEARDR